MEKKGIDVSVHNGNINWSAVKNSGIEFAIIRASYGRNSVDSKAIRNITECIRVGMPFGVYTYSYALNLEQAKSEAQLILRTIAPYKEFVKYPVIIDMEDADGYKLRNGMPSKQMLTDICKTECEMFKAEGYIPMIYANLDWFRNKLDITQLVSYEKWLAQWSSKPTWGQPFSIWQYSSSGTVPGISGRVDMNVAYKDFGVATTYIPKSNEEIANEVINGEWGNGDERKNRLIAAGYDYNIIQAIVNSRVTTRSNEEIAKEVIDGKWGNGAERKARLANAGYSYDVIQTIVNNLVDDNKYYEVQSGDYLAKIGGKLGVDWHDIANKNGIKPPYIIYRGQKLKY